MAYEIKRFPFSGTVDADGHILESADWRENYLEKLFRRQRQGDLPPVLIGFGGDKRRRRVNVGPD